MGLLSKLLPKKNNDISFECEITGGWAECKKAPKTKRRDVLMPLPIGTALRLEQDYYKNAPYFLICAPNGLDLGAMPSEYNQKIRASYPNSPLSAVLIDKTDDTHAIMRVTIHI